MVVHQRMGVWRRRVLAVGIALGLIAYFGWHAFHGRHGIYARQALEARAAELQRELDVATAERRALERRVSLLRAESLDPDLLEIRARETLSMIHANDVVILERRGPALSPPAGATPLASQSQRR